MDTPTADPQQAPESEPLYYLCTIYTWALLAMNVIELFTGKAPPDHALSTAYFAILAAYAGNKEIGKWRGPQPDANAPKRKGERFVAAWAVFLLVAAILAAGVRPFELGRVHFEPTFPHELLAIFLEVLAVFTGTKVSRKMRAGEPITPLGRRSREPRVPRVPAGPTTPPAPRASISSTRSIPSIEDDPKILAGLMDGCIIGALSDGEELTSAQLLASAKPMYPKTNEDIIDRVINQMMLEGDLVQATPGPRGPDTKYKLTE